MSVDLRFMCRRIHDVAAGAVQNQRSGEYSTNFSVDAN
jgi:hypothetical protein